MRIVPFIALLGSLCASPAFAGSVVQFEDGRSMVVENVVEQGEATVHLQLEGGGTISMPASRILSWTPLPSVADERQLNMSWLSATGEERRGAETAARKTAPKPLAAPGRHWIWRGAVADTQVVGSFALRPCSRGDAGRPKLR